MWYRCLRCAAVFNKKMAKDKVADWGSGEKDCPYCGADDLEKTKPCVVIHKL